MAMVMTFPHEIAHSPQILPVVANTGYDNKKKCTSMGENKNRYGIIRNKAHGSKNNEKSTKGNGTDDLWHTLPYQLATKKYQDHVYGISFSVTKFNSYLRLPASPTIGQKSLPLKPTLSALDNPKSKIWTKTKERKRKNENETENNPKIERSMKPKLKSEMEPKVTENEN